MLSFIIPTLNEHQTIERTLRCLSAYSADHEIIVSDGNSSDDTVEICRRFTDRIVVHEQSRRQTIAEARNLGAAAARGDYLVFVDADVVVTSSSGWAHGFRTNGAKLVHCHTPAHWLYALEHYLKPDGDKLKRAVLKVGSPALRSWDQRAATTVDRYLAVSTAIKDRIQTAYGIDAGVLPSPISMRPDAPAEPVPEVAHWLTDGGEPFYLCVSRLMAYKNVDAVIGAFAHSDRRLVVVGHGPEAARLERLKTPNVALLSALTDGQMAWLYQSCRALIAASYEDFGLTPIEAAVSGKPSVVLRWGGFLDTVVEGSTGVFFDRPEPAAIAEALDRFEAGEFDPDRLRAHAERFTEARYAESLYAAVDEIVTRTR